MYHKLKVRFPWSTKYEDVAIDDINIDIVKPGGRDQSVVYDMDGVLCCEIGMDYDELVSRLNGEEVPEKPVPKTVERWVVSSSRGWNMTHRTLDAARDSADYMESIGEKNITLTHLTGEEQPWTSQ